MSTQCQFVIVDVFCNSSGVLLARNQTQQDFSDRIKLDGIDERIGARVRKCDDYCDIEASVNRFWIHPHIYGIDVARQPWGGEKCADKYHGFDHIGLNLVRLCLSMGLSGAWSSGSVAGHHFCLTTDHNQNAPVTEDEDEEYNDVKRTQNAKSRGFFWPLHSEWWHNHSILRLSPQLMWTWMLNAIRNLRPMRMPLPSISSSCAVYSYSRLNVPPSDSARWWRLPGW